MMANSRKTIQSSLSPLPSPTPSSTSSLIVSQNAKMAENLFKNKQEELNNNNNSVYNNNNIQNNNKLGIDLYKTTRATTENATLTVPAIVTETTTTTTTTNIFDKCAYIVEKMERELTNIIPITTTTTLTTTTEDDEDDKIIITTTIKLNEKVQEIQQTEAIDKMNHNEKQSNIYCNSSSSNSNISSSHSNKTKNLHAIDDDDNDVQSNVNNDQEDDLKTRYNNINLQNQQHHRQFLEKKEQIQQQLSSYCNKEQKHSNIAIATTINIIESKVEQQKSKIQNYAEAATVTATATNDDDDDDQVDVDKVLLLLEIKSDDGEANKNIEKAIPATIVATTTTTTCSNGNGKSNCAGNGDGDCKKTLKKMQSQQPEMLLSQYNNKNNTMLEEKEPKEETKSREELLCCVRDQNVGHINSYNNNNNNCTSNDQQQHQNQSKANSLAKKSVVRDLTKAVSGYASNETQHVVKIHVNSSSSSSSSTNFKSRDNTINKSRDNIIINEQTKPIPTSTSTSTNSQIPKIKGKQVSVINLNGRDQKSEEEKDIGLIDIVDFDSMQKIENSHQKNQVEESISLKPEATKLHLNINTNKTMVMLKKPNSLISTSPTLSTLSTSSIAIATPTAAAAAATTLTAGGAVTVATSPNSKMSSTLIGSGNHGNHGGTSITELNGNTTATNTNSSPYLYYVVSSGQFSPCETLDSGTGSDLDNNNSATTTKLLKSNKTPRSKTDAIPTTIVDIVNVNCIDDKKTKQKIMDSELVPQMEIHLTTTKIRFNNKKPIKTKSKSKISQNPIWTTNPGSTTTTINSNNNNNNTNSIDTTNTNLQRAYSLTDSEESANMSSSSLSCDSLHSGEYAGHHNHNHHHHHQQQQQPHRNQIQNQKLNRHGHGNTFLPDSLLRDIRNRKFTTNDVVDKYGKVLSINNAPSSSALQTFADNDHNEDDDYDNESLIYDVTTTKPNTTLVNELSQTISTTTTTTTTNPCYEPLKQKFPNGFYNDSQEEEEDDDDDVDDDEVDDQDDEEDIDEEVDETEVVAEEQQEKNVINKKIFKEHHFKYEEDKYYDFHVKEHENFRSFGNNSLTTPLSSLSLNNCNNNDYNAATAAATTATGAGNGFSLNPSDSQLSLKADETFAGYKDIRCKSSSSTIRSARGTIRGVKNRVRNGIATFLQLQQPNVKNYKEKEMGKVVLYTTSMGIIRDTHAKCTNIRKILRTLLIKFEERDVFMSIEYQQEIRDRMNSPVISVPQLFVEGQHIGDAETVERMNESGELRQLLKPYKSIASTFTCQTCGGYRLLPCPSCNGSKKSVHRNHFTAEFVALKCMNCDEVGLVKCHNC